MSRAVSRMRAPWPAGHVRGPGTEAGQCRKPSRWCRTSAASADVDDLMNEIRPKKDREIVAFLGSAGAGRTVVAALVKHTLSTVWVPQSRGLWEARAESGHDEINAAIREMKRGRFPSVAAKSSYPPLKIGIYRTKGYVSRFEMTIRGKPGEEDCFERWGMQGDDVDASEMVASMLKGGCSDIVHATRYVLMIDCAGTGGWNEAKSRVDSALNAIRQIKKIAKRPSVVGHTKLPIALLFTKADALPDKHRDLAASGLASKCLGLAPDLEAPHCGPTAWFKVHADVGGGGFSPHTQGGGGRGGAGGGGGGNTAAAPGRPLLENRPARGLCYSDQEYRRLIEWLVRQRDPNDGGKQYF